MNCNQCQANLQIGQRFYGNCGSNVDAKISKTEGQAASKALPIQGSHVKPNSSESNQMKILMDELRTNINNDFKRELGTGLSGLRTDLTKEMIAIRQETANEFKKVREENKIESEKNAVKFDEMDKRFEIVE